MLLFGARKLVHRALAAKENRQKDDEAYQDYMRKNFHNRKKKSARHRDWQCHRLEKAASQVDEFDENADNQKENATPNSAEQNRSCHSAGIRASCGPTSRRVPLSQSDEHNQDRRKPLGESISQPLENRGNRNIQTPSKPSAADGSKKSKSSYEYYRANKGSDEKRKARKGESYDYEEATYRKGDKKKMADVVVDIISPIQEQLREHMADLEDLWTEKVVYDSPNVDPAVVRQKVRHDIYDMLRGKDVETPEKILNKIKSDILDRVCATFAQLKAAGGRTNEEMRVHQTFMSLMGAGLKSSRERLLVQHLTNVRCKIAKAGIERSDKMETLKDR